MAKIGLTKAIYCAVGGLFIASIGIGYYLYRKFYFYTFSSKILEYLEDVKFCLSKICSGSTEISQSKIIKFQQNRIPIDIYCLILLLVNEYTEEQYREDYPEDKRKRLDLLKELEDDSNNLYYSEVLEQIDKKDKLFYKAYDVILDAIKNIAKVELSLDIKININLDSFFNQLLHIKEESFKSTIKALKRYTEPEDSEELDYYKRVKIKMEDENNIIQFVEFITQLSDNVSDLIVQKRYTKNNTKISNENIKLLIVNDIIMKDTVMFNFGISYEHFIYLIENSNTFNNNISLRMKYDKIDTKDRFINI